MNKKLKVPCEPVMSALTSACTQPKVLAPATARSLVRELAVADADHFPLGFLSRQTSRKGKKMRFALLLLAVIVAAAPQFAFAQFVTGSDEGASKSSTSTPKAKAAPKVKKAKAKPAPKAQ